ncbi:MAG: hypothetical protein JO029_12530 [Candidatus Eremiobacteraeota bacterium]|nr:hypothetical protein [Candidatus Eremiobacteraeota bacterium]
MDVLDLFAIAPYTSRPTLGTPGYTDVVTGFLPVKTFNVERAQRIHRPGEVLADIPDNADIAGPDSVYDYYA